MFPLVTFGIIECLCGLLFLAWEVTRGKILALHQLKKKVEDPKYMLCVWGKKKK